MGLLKLSRGAVPDNNHHKVSKKTGEKCTGRENERKKRREKQQNWGDEDI